MKVDMPREPLWKEVQYPIMWMSNEDIKRIVIGLKSTKEEENTLVVGVDQAINAQKWIQQEYTNNF